MTGVSRLTSALRDLAELQERTATLAEAGCSPELRGALETIEHAFEAEVFELRLLAACDAFGLCRPEGIAPDTDDGSDCISGVSWWLFESSMRSLHTGVAAMAQTINVVFGFGKDPASSCFKHEVSQTLLQDTRRTELAQSFRNAYTSPEFYALDAFVRRERFASVPHSKLNFEGGSLTETRPPIEAGEFVHRQWPYGPWTPRETAIIIDGVRRGILEVLDAVITICRAERFLARTTRRPDAAS